MKKLLVFSLLAVMLISLFVVGVSAAEEKISLLPKANAGWTCDPCGSPGVMEVTKGDNGAVVFTNIKDEWGWPYAIIYFDEPITVSIEDSKLEYDFDVSHHTNITFLLAGDSAFTLSCDKVNVPFDAGSGDIEAGTYKGSVTLKNLVKAKTNYGDHEFPAAAISDGKVTFTGLQVYSSGPLAATTIRTLRIRTKAAEEAGDESEEAPEESEEVPEESEEAPAESEAAPEESEEAPAESEAAPAESEAVEPAGESKTEESKDEGGEGGSNVGLIIGIIAAVVVVIGGVVFFMSKGKKGGAAA